MSMWPSRPCWHWERPRPRSNPASPTATGACTSTRPATLLPLLGLAPWRVVSADAEMQLDPVALPLDRIDVALAGGCAAGLKGEQLGVPGERLEGCQHVPYGPAKLLCQAAAGCPAVVVLSACSSEH